MALFDTPERYGTATRWLHWLIAAFVGLAWVSADEGGIGFGIHASLGTLVLGLGLARLLWRVANPRAPGDPPGTPAWQARAARLAQGALYLLCLLVPLTGLLDRWSVGRPPGLFGGLLVLPAPLPIPRLGGLWGGVHELSAHLLLILVGAHVVAALWHQLVLGDGVLRRMLPGRRAGPPRG